MIVNIGRLKHVMLSMGLMAALLTVSLKTLKSEPSQEITRETIGEINEVTRLGGGTVDGGAWSPNGQIFALRGTLGTRIYDVGALSTPRLLDERSVATDVAFNVDGTLLATANGNLIRLWDTTTWDVVADLSGQPSNITMLVFAPDGKTLVSVDETSTVRLWDIPTRTLKAEMNQPDEDAFDTIAVSPDSRLLAAKRQDAVYIWRVSDGSQVTILTQEYEIKNWTLLAFSADGQWLSAGYPLWKVEGEQFTYTQRSDKLPDEGLTLYTGAIPPEALNTYSDAAVQFWGYVGAYSRKAWSQGVTMLPNASGQYVLVINEDKVELWTRGGMLSQTVLHWNTKSLWGLSTSPDGMQVMARSYIDIHMWNVNAPQTYQLFNPYLVNSDVRAAFWVGDSFKGLFVEEFGGSWRDLATNTTLYAFPTLHLQSSSGPLFSADGHWMTLGGSDKTLTLYDMTTGMPRSLLNPDSALSQRPTVPLAYNADGSILAVWSPEKDCESGDDCSSIMLWNTATGTLISSLGQFQGQPGAAVFAADSSRLYIGGRSVNLNETNTGYQGHIDVWDLARGEKTGEMAGLSGIVNRLWVSPNGQFVAASIKATDEYLMWDVQSESPRLVLSVEDTPNMTPDMPNMKTETVVFTPQSDLLLLGTASGSIDAFDTATGEKISTFHHVGRITGLVLADEGRALISSAEDGTIRVWRIEDATPQIYEWTPIPMAFPSPTFSPASSITPEYPNFPMATLVPGSGATAIPSPMPQNFSTATPWGGTPAESFLTSMPAIPTQE